MRETAISAQLLKAPILLLGLIFTVSCSDLSEYDRQQVRTALNDSLIATTESWDVEMTLLQDGQKRMLIEGSHAVNYQSEENKRTNIDGPVYVQLYDSLGNTETEAWSKRAIYYENAGEFELIDSVKVQSGSDRFLYSEYLKYIQQTDEISSPYYVTIITPTDSISGRGFEGLTDLSSYTIKEPRGRLIVE